MKKSRALSFCLILSSVLVASAQMRTANTLAFDMQNQAASIKLDVDATDAPRKILHAHLTIPAAPGPLTLLYPKWIPGEHGPTGPITDLVDLRFTAGGQTLTWERDQSDMYTFHLEVPPRAKEVEVALDFLLSANTSGFSSGASASSQLDVLNWNQVLLYPQGRPAEELIFNPTLKLPVGWKFGTALPVTREANSTIKFEPVSLVTLIDSPVASGAHFRHIPLTTGAAPTHVIDLVSDSDAALQMSPHDIAGYKQLVSEAYALFGARHYRNYHFLFTLSDQVANFGLEHHESSDDRVQERSLIDPMLNKLSVTLLPHEYVHSWNGKYRRPADITNADYQQPMRTELLWVYEGLTQYLGSILIPRSGLWTDAEFREYLAWNAAYLDARTGRQWRPLSDTAVAAQLLYYASPQWANARRSVDYYDESILVWLDADTRIRQLTNGQRSLDDFCRRFHGGTGGAPAVKTYTFEDVVNTLNEVAPNGDWRAFLNTRVRAVNPHAPMGGIEAGGWQLVFNEQPNDYIGFGEATRNNLELSFSLGMSLGADGAITDVVPGMVAEQAGLAPWMKIIAVNGRRYSADVMREAVAASKTNNEPLELIVENAEYFKTYRLNYHGGARYPHLERIANRPDLLTQIIKPLTARVALATGR